MSESMLTILDCDGVLIDSEIVASRAMSKALTKAGFPLSVDDLISRFTGMTDEQICAVLSKESGRAMPEGLAGAVAAELDEQLASVKPIAGVEDMLDRIEGPFCVCSNSRMSRLRLSLGAVGLFDRLMPNIFSAVEVGSRAPKPAPDVYLHGARQMGFDPADCVVVEDSVHGVAGGVAAGMRVIGFTGASHSWRGHAEALMDAGAETVVRKLSEVPPVLVAFRAWKGLPA